MSVENFYLKLEDNNKNAYYNPHGEKGIQHPARILLTAPSNSGKTNFLMNVIKTFKNWENFVIITADPSDKLYEWFFKKISEVNKERIILSNKLEDLPKLDSLDKDLQNLIIFDDIITEKNFFPEIERYFIRGRKKNCTIIMITQNYYSVNPLVRNNCSNLYMRDVFKRRDLNQILQDFSQLNMDIDELKKKYQEATKNKLDFFGIDIYGNLYKNFEKK